MKVSVYIDELYPFFFINENPSGAYYPIVDVPDDLVEKFKNTIEEFYKVQDEVEKYYTKERVK